MKKLFIIPLVFFFSCQDYTTRIEKRIYTRYVCDCNQKREVVEAIKASIKNANNMSDEEMEDVVEQLERTYVHTICQQQNVSFIVDEKGYCILDTTANKSDSCRNVMNF